MNSIKNMIMSVLLFSFTLSIVHDYAFVDTYESSQQNDKYYSVDIENEYAGTKDVKYQLHHSFHILLEISLVEKLQLPLITLTGKPFYMQENLTSHVQTVLQRPPSIS